MLRPGQTSTIFLAVFSFGCAFKIILACTRLPHLQSFKMDSGEESEVEVSSRDGEGEFKVFGIFFFKKCCIVLYEMLHSFGQPSVKHD